MSNPHPVPYSSNRHKADCFCPICKAKRSGKKTYKAFRLDKTTLDRLLKISQETGKNQTKVIEEAVQNYYKEVIV